MQNINLVGANFDIGHQYSRPASHTFFQYHILQPINPINLLVLHNCTMYSVHLDTKYHIMQPINLLILRVLDYRTPRCKVYFIK